MLKYCAGAMATLFIASAIFAQDQKEKEPPGTPAEQYAKLVKEYDAARRAFMVKYQKAKTAEERQKLFAEYPRPEQYSARFLGLAEKNPGDPSATDALTWVVSNAGRQSDGRKAAEILIKLVEKNPAAPANLKALIAMTTTVQGPVADQAMDLLIKSYIDNDELGTVCLRMIYNRSPKADEMLRAIMAKSTNQTVLGLAHLALAKRMLRSSSEPSSEALALLEKIVADFADVKYRGRSLSKMAEGDLFEIKHLQIGMAAPNIEGEDIDGQKFALSDYKGKVVVLDFWGDW